MLHAIVRAAVAGAVLCFSLPALAQPEPPTVDEVKQVFARDFGESCPWVNLNEAVPEPDVYELAFDAVDEGRNAVELPYRLYRFVCEEGGGLLDLGMVVFMAWDQADGIRALQFARPELNVEYSDGTWTRVSRLHVVGITADPWLSDAKYDPSSQTIVADDGRGTGDSAATYVFDRRLASFQLRTYDVDVTLDGLLDKVRVVDYSKPQAFK